MESLENVSSKQDVLENKIEKATEGISTIISHLANASSNELNEETKQAVNHLMTTVCPSSTSSPPSKTGTSLNMSSDQIKVICDQVTELFNDLASFRAELTSLNEQLNTYITSNKKDIANMKKDFADELALLRADYMKEIQMMKQKSIDHDQYLRKNNLILGNFLLPNWARKKDCNGYALACYVAFWINNFLPMLSTPVTPHNINITHPLRNNSKGQSVLIIRFVNRHIRNDIFYNRQALLQHGITVTEHLAPENLILRRKAEAIVGESNVWSQDCKLYAFSHGKTISIWNEKSLSFLKPPYLSRIAALEKHNPTSNFSTRH